MDLFNELFLYKNLTDRFFFVYHRFSVPKPWNQNFYFYFTENGHNLYLLIQVAKNVTNILSFFKGKFLEGFVNEVWLSKYFVRVFDTSQIKM